VVDVIDRDVEQLILDHMGIVRDYHVTTSVHKVRIDDGADTYIVTVMQFELIGDVSLHTLTRYVAHEVDDLWNYKLLDERVFTDLDLFDGTFDYVDDDNKTAGHITFDYANDRDPIITEDKTYTEPKGK
jgi:hypothetical protein